jgi:hypothetical protein
MKAKKLKDITAIFREGTPIDRALAAGAREAIRRHKQAGVPMAVWRNGKTVWVDAAELEGKPRNGRAKHRHKPADH